MFSINFLEKIFINENFEFKDVFEMNILKLLLFCFVWNSQVVFLRVIFRVKKVLDKMNFLGQLLIIVVLNIVIFIVYIGFLCKFCKDKNIFDFKLIINGES